MKENLRRVEKAEKLVKQFLMLSQQDNMRVRHLPKGKIAIGINK